MFEKIFGREETEKKEYKASDQTDANEFAPNTRIAYKSTLIPALEKDHENLLEVYDQAAKAAQSGMDERSKMLFSQFKSMFVDHILRENTSLYLYLKHSARGDDSKKSIHSIKIEMERIAREAMKFLDYAIEESTLMDDEFLQRMEQISETIHKRIKHEEEFVYPIYRSINRVSKV